MTSSTIRRESHAAGLTRAGLEQLLSPSLPPECSRRLWDEAWEWAGVTPWTLWAWCRRFGTEIAALAVAAGVDEPQMRQHLADDRVPDRAVLEMLADLNCFPYATPAARPVPTEAMAEVGA